MPITSAGSYLPVTQEFISHWTLVNTALGSPLLLSGGYALADLISGREAIESAILATVGSENVREISATNRDHGKGRILARIGEFRNGVRFRLPGSGYALSLPLAPKFLSNPAIYLRPFDSMALLWGKIDADMGVAGFTPPLLLVGGYARADFMSELADLRTSYTAVNNANEAARLNRKLRDLLLPHMKQRLMEYRLAVLAIFGAAHALTLSLPAVYPSGGRTPEKVKLTVKWNAVTGKADLSWTPSANADLAYFSVRTAPDPYNAAEEREVARVPAGMLSYSTDAGLLAPGARAQFKVYVVLTSGKEKGSRTVSVTRPL